MIFKSYLGNECISTNAGKGNFKGKKFTGGLGAFEQSRDRGVTEVTSGLRVFRVTMKRPLAKEVMGRLAQGKYVPSFGDLEEVEVGFLARRPSAQVHALEVSTPLKMSWLTLLGWGPR